MEDHKHFIKSWEWIAKELPALHVSHVLNSIGSNIFIGFGKDTEVMLPNNKTMIRKECRLWISASSWRISRSERYLIGSGDDRTLIQEDLPKLLGNCFDSYCFLSQFLDFEFYFKNGDKLTIFFNWIEEDQWILFLPDQTEIWVDCSSQERINNVRALSNQLQIKENYKNIDLPKRSFVVDAIIYDKHDLPTFICEDDIRIVLDLCTWRLEKNGQYCFGYLDGNNNVSTMQAELSGIIGKKVTGVSIANAMMDARIQFEDGYILKTFSCCPTETQWHITYQGKPFFSATIELFHE